MNDKDEKVVFLKDVQEGNKGKKKAATRKPQKRAVKRVIPSSVRERDFVRHMKMKENPFDLMCRCYLCDREEGDRYMLYMDDDSARAVRCDLRTYSIPLGDGLSLKFLVCDECSALLTFLRGESKSES